VEEVTSGLHRYKETSFRTPAVHVPNVNFALKHDRTFCSFSVELRTFQTFW